MKDKDDSLPFDGDELAGLFRHINSEHEAGFIIAQFFKLVYVEQVKFLSWLAGNIAGNNEKEKGR